MISNLLFRFFHYFIYLCNTCFRHFSLRQAAFEFWLSVIAGFVSVSVSWELIVRKDFKHSISVVGIYFVCGILILF